MGKYFREPKGSGQKGRNFQRACAQVNRREITGISAKGSRSNKKDARMGHNCDYAKDLKRCASDKQAKARTAGATTPLVRARW